MFFRANTVEKAKKLGVVGHVENTSRGTVTGEVQGEPKPVSLMKVSICFQAGQIIQVTVSASVVCRCRTGCKVKVHLELGLTSAHSATQAVIWIN